MKIQEIFDDLLFRDIVKTNTKNMIQYMVDSGIEFSIVVNIKGVTFNPQLPKVIIDKFTDFTTFDLSNYTFSTIELYDDLISFEAGFGRENFGSLCTIPYNAIFQIVIDNSMLHLNPLATADNVIKEYIEDDNTSEDIENSLDIFLNNPDNKHLFKK